MNILAIWIANPPNQADNDDVSLLYEFHLKVNKIIKRSMSVKATKSVPFGAIESNMKREENWAVVLLALTFTLFKV